MSVSCPICDKTFANKYSLASYKVDTIMEANLRIQGV